MEQTVTKLKVEKAQAVSSLKEEEAKCNLLLREIKDSNEVQLCGVYDVCMIKIIRVHCG